MNDIDFKNTMVASLKTDTFRISNKLEITSALESSNLYIEYTGIFTRIEWNTFCAVLHLQVDLKYYDLCVQTKKEILSLANKIFGKQDDYYLTEIDIGIKVISNGMFSFDEIKYDSATIEKAFNDAEMFISQNNYSSAIDRVHTAYHGYLREKLTELEIEFSDDDSLTQLYSKLHNNYISEREGKFSEVIKRTIRSASSVIDTFNEVRNNYSLSHPNSEILDNDDAKLLIKLVKAIFEYIESIV